uniref:vitamin-K-epoxide reductase (warfarin-sensitive) n=1 Tax=Rhipicephalus zambeziensis TaxID=60191 RepID=A0A224Z3R9_9ACAR
MLPANPQARRSRLKIFNAVVCVVGVVVSVYAYVVETRAEEDPKYSPMCDLSPNVSCTKAFNSEYGKGMGLLQRFVGNDSVLVQPNSVYGIIFYVTVLICGMLNGGCEDCFD